MKKAIIAISMLGLIGTAFASGTTNLPLQWLGIAFVIVAMVIAIAAIVYQLAYVINSSSLREWAKSQILEAILSIIMLMIFGIFLLILLSNPTSALNKFNMLPSQCLTANSIYSVSTCDMSQFSSIIFQRAQQSFFYSFIFSFSPKLTIGYTPEPLVAPGYSIGTSIPLLPSPSSLTIIFSFLFVSGVLSQIQLLLLSIAEPLMLIFFTIGVVARTIGFMRGFGGALIAIAISLGIIYPLLVAFSYGYIVTQMNSYSCSAGLCIIQALFGLVTGSTSSFNSVALYFGTFIAGLIFVPILNFVILETFTSDFSASMGERISFVSLFSGTNLV